MRAAHLAHTECTGPGGHMSANGVLGAGPDAVIVGGDWLEHNLRAAEAGDDAALSESLALKLEAAAAEITAVPELDTTARVMRLIRAEHYVQAAGIIRGNPDQATSVSTSATSGP
ncbi:hypothetical protein [Cellulomonas chengniuliangii]|nr:hypothetical protein [Cellulomonas chengniuliangii]MCC2317544.1 hypothetical protein [Cellulomonas chengniuliangii]